MLPGVEDFKPGQRFLVQTDYRWLRTADSNSAFGYNFEGGLQQYVIMDERVFIDPAASDRSCRSDATTDSRANGGLCAFRLVLDPHRGRHQGAKSDVDDK